MSFFTAVVTSLSWLVWAFLGEVANLATVLALDTSCRTWFCTFSRSVTGLSAIATGKTILPWLRTVTSTMPSLFTVNTFDSRNLAL